MLLELLYSLMIFFSAINGIETEVAWYDTSSDTIYIPVTIDEERYIAKTNECNIVSVHKAENVQFYNDRTTYQIVEDGEIVDYLVMSSGTNERGYMTMIMFRDGEMLDHTLILGSVLSFTNVCDFYSNPSPLPGTFRA